MTLATLERAPVIPAQVRGDLDSLVRDPALRPVAKRVQEGVRLSEAEIREAIAPVVSEIIDGIRETIEETPPELIGDLMEHGIVLAGCGAQIRGIDKLIATELKMPVWITDDPQTAVVRGCGKLLDDPVLLAKVKIAARKV